MIPHHIAVMSEAIDAFTLGDFYEGPEHMAAKVANALDAAGYVIRQADDD